MFFVYSNSRKRVRIVEELPKFKITPKTAREGYDSNYKSNSEKTNEILRSKLIQFNNQNKENVKKAKKEIEELKNEIEINEKDNIKLYKEIEEANKRLQQLVEENSNKNKEKERRDQIIKEFRKTTLTTKFINYLRYATEVSKVLRNLQIDKNCRLGRKILQILKQNLLIAKVIKYRSEIRKRNLLDKVFNGLHMNIEWNAKLISIKNLAEIDLLKKAFDAFKNLLELKKFIQDEYNNAIMIYLHALQLRAFKGFKKMLSETKLSAEEEQQLSQSCKKYSEKNLAHKSLISLQIWTLIKKKRKFTLKRASNYYALKLLKKIMLVFNLLYCIKKKREQKMNKYILLRKMRLLSKYMMYLKFYMNERRKINILKTIGIRAILKRMFDYWKNIWNKKISEREHESAVYEYSNIKLCKKGWKGLLIYNLKRKREWILMRTVKAKYFLKLRKSCIKKWIKKGRMILFYSKILGKRNSRIARRCLTQWKHEYHIRKIEGMENHFADLLRKRILRNGLKNILKKWFKVANRRKLSNVFRSKFDNNRALNLKREIFYRWFNKTLLLFKEQISKDLKLDYEELQLRNQETTHIIEQLEQEYANYQGILNKEQKNKECLENELSDKEMQLSQKEAEYKKKTMEFDELQIALEGYNNETINLKRKSEQIFNDFEYAKTNHEEIMKSLKRENEELTHQLEDAEEELKDKHQVLTDTEKALIEINTARTKQNDHFGELEDVNKSNINLMNSLESKHNELVSLEDELGHLISENQILKQQVL